MGRWLSRWAMAQGNPRTPPSLLGSKQAGPGLQSQAAAQQLEARGQQQPLPDSSSSQSWPEIFLARPWQRSPLVFPPASPELAWAATAPELGLLRFELLWPRLNAAASFAAPSAKHPQSPPPESPLVPLAWWWLPRISAHCFFQNRMSPLEAHHRFLAIPCPEIRFLPVSFRNWDAQLSAWLRSRSFASLLHLHP